METMPSKGWSCASFAANAIARAMIGASVTVLGILRRAVQGEYRAWSRHQRKARDSTCPSFLEKMGRRVNLVIRYLTGDVSRL